MKSFKYVVIYHCDINESCVYSKFKLHEDVAKLVNGEIWDEITRQLPEPVMNMVKRQCGETVRKEIYEIC